jgi:hypothetical protein
VRLLTPVEEAMFVPDKERASTRAVDQERGVELRWLTGSGPEGRHAKFILSVKGVQIGVEADERFVLNAPPAERGTILNVIRIGERFFHLTESGRIVIPPYRFENNEERQIIYTLFDEAFRVLMATSERPVLQINFPFPPEA